MQSPPSARSRTLVRLVVRNTVYLTASQVLTVPLAVAVNATLARYLGPSDFGFLYLATTICSFGFLAINWGHEGALPALVAKDRSLSGVLLGSSLAWRTASCFVVYALLAFVCHLLDYGRLFQWALGLTFAMSLVSSLISACKDTIRGFERTDIPALAHVGQQFFVALLVVPVLMLGGGMRASLAAQIPACMLILVLIWLALPGVGVTPLKVDRSSIKALFMSGTPFVFFNIALELQPNIDAVFLSKLAPPEVIGWFAVSRRLIGLLLFPATALVGALYPTLCRLHVENFTDYRRVARGAFQGVALLAVPAAVGCGLYPEIGVSIFSRRAFGASEDNLRVLAVFLFLVYFSMPLGTCILAAGKQRAWSIVQVSCLVVSLALDPLLVPWFQSRMGNGGLGLCVAAIVSESVVVVAGIALMPRGIFDRKLVMSVFLALVAGGAMGGAAWLMKPLNPWLAAPLAGVAYVAVLWVTGGVDQEQIAAGRAFFARKFSRR